MNRQAYRGEEAGTNEEVSTLLVFFQWVQSGIYSAGLFWAKDIKILWVWYKPSLPFTNDVTL